MTIKCILTIFVCFFSYVLSMHLAVPKQDSPCHKLNVVLFFARSPTNCGIPKEIQTVKCLGMNEVARVKHSVPVFPNNGPSMGGSMQRGASCNSDCTELLKDGLSSLTHFCQNALGMKTAIVSVSAQEITKDLTEDQEIPEEMRQRQIPSPENFLRYDVFQKADNKVPAPSFPKPNEPIPNNVITSPEHTEVFNIRVKRQANGKNEEPGEIVSIPLEQENNKIPLDLLNFIAQVKYSFFGKLFENQAKNKLAAEGNHIPGEISITNKDPGLFETVRSTLTSLQDAPGEEFLMVVFGGHLSEMSNNNSPLVQSVKHVIESTDPEKTLIVLTGTCSKQEGGQANERAANGHNEQSAVLPIFAKGPKSGKLTECLELHDVPLIVKNILAETSPSFGDGAVSARQRRSLFSGVQANRERRNDAAPAHINDKFYSVIFYLCVSILFIL